MSSDRLRPFFATLPPPRSATPRRARALSHAVDGVPRSARPHRLRRLAAKVFHVRSMHALRPNIESLTQWLLDSIGERREFDFIAEFAGPLPALVIMDMLGVPREELGRLKRLSDEMALFIGSSRDVPEKYASGRGDPRDGGYLPRARSARRAAPQRDLLTELVASTKAASACRRTSWSRPACSCSSPGTRPPRITSRNCARCLLFRVSLRRRADPSLAPAAVEELLRYDGPIGAQVRIVQSRIPCTARRCGVASVSSSS